jgi:hypothetical protein
MNLLSKSEMYVSRSMASLSERKKPDAFPGGFNGLKNVSTN